MKPRLAYFRARAETLLRDRCIVQARQGKSRNVYGYGGREYVPGQLIPCQFEQTAQTEVAQSTTQTALANATIRLPLGTPAQPSPPAGRPRA